MNILLVSNEENFSNNLKKRLVFLRKNDAITSVLYSDAFAEVTLSRANIVLVHETEQNKTLSLIEKLKEFKNLSVIFIAETTDLILPVYDLGIDDYIMASAEDYEYVIRIINNIKHNSVKLNLLRDEKLLEQHKAIDELTGFYSCPKLVVENVIDNDLLTYGMFMALSPSNESKSKYSIESFSDVIKKSVRAEDVVCVGQGVNIYIFMPNTDFNGAIIVLNKIKENLNFSICAGISDICGKVYDIFERDAIKALSEALATNREFVFEHKNEEVSDEWLNDEVKNYKLFRKMYSKKLEKEISPVFYRLQKSYEEKLFGTEIEQYITDEQCVFKLKNKKLNSSLNIIYPGFAKIIIDVTHEGLDSPENKEFQLSLAKVNQKEISDIVENFIKEYKASIL